MRTNSIRGWAAGALLSCLLASVGSPASAGPASVQDSGWRVTEQAGQSVLELHALVVNDSEAPLSYQVRFLLESSSLPAVPKLTAASQEAATMPPANWSVEQTVTATGDPVAAGGSCPVAATLPSSLLQPGKQYRCRAELVDGQTQAVTAQSCVTPRQNVWGPLVAAGVVAVAINRSNAEVHPTVFFGHLEGTHSAQRTGNKPRAGQWLERGSGRLVMRTTEGRAVLDYTYHSSGESAATLVATMTATGQLTRFDGRVEPVVITLGHANITNAGDRRQVGQVITRTGSTATGTFSGTEGGRPLSGVVTLVNGTQTLDLVTGEGTHSFDIQFVPSS